MIPQVLMMMTVVPREVVAESSFASSEFHPPPQPFAFGRERISDIRFVVAIDHGRIAILI